MSENESMEDLFGLDIDIEEASFGSVYPIVQWVNGDPGKKKSGGLEYHGGFFVSAEQGLEIPGSEPYTLITANGDEVEGHMMRDLVIIPIRYRRSWLAMADEDGLSQRFPWNAYEDAKEFDYNDSPRGRGQLLCRIVGMDEEVVVTLSGMTAAAVFSSGRVRGVIPTFGQIVLNRAKQIANRAGRNIAYPLCAFKLSIGPKRDEKGVPVFDKVGSGTKTSQITLPVWLDKPAGMPDEADIRRRFVGSETYGKVQDAYKEATEWADQWSSDSLIEQLTKAAVTRAKLSALSGGGAVAAAGAAGGLPKDREVPF